VQEDEVLFEKTNEDSVIVATTSVALTQSTSHNVTVLSEKLLEKESVNLKLKDEIISLREEMKKRRKVNVSMILLKENILEQQENLHDVKVECFMEIQKIVEKVKSLEKHLEIVSQINLKMESLQAKIEEIDKWRNMKKNVPSSLLVVKSYDIKWHTLAMNECQELASNFEEKVW
jgi:small-conductance mechanosensitive channel